MAGEVRCEEGLFPDVVLSLVTAGRCAILIESGGGHGRGTLGLGLEQVLVEVEDEIVTRSESGLLFGSGGLRCVDRSAVGNLIRPALRG